MIESNRESKDFDQMVKKMTQNLIYNIEKEIIDQSLDFSDNRASLDNLVKKKKSIQDIKRSKFPQEVKPLLDQLKSMKQSKIFQIKELERKQNILKKSTINKKPLKAQSVAKLQKSEFTKAQMKQIKKIMKKKQYFQEQLKEKEEKLSSFIHEKKIEEEQHKKKQLQEKCQQRKKQLAKQRQQMRKNQQIRKQKIEEEINKIKQLKKRKNLYEHMSQQWKKMQAAEESQKKHQWDVLKVKRKIGSKEIEQHQKKYIQERKQRQVQRQEDLCRKKQQSRIELPYLYNRIYYQIQKEEEYKKVLEQSKQEQIEKNINNKKQFAKLVKDIFLPKIKAPVLDASSRNNSITSLKKDPLDYYSTFRLGNQYMKLAHEKIPLSKIQNEKKSPIVQESGGYSANYKNYLVQLKQLNKQNKQISTADLINMLRSTKLDESKKLNKIKQMSNKTRFAKNDQEIIINIKNKLHILKELIN